LPTPPKVACAFNGIWWSFLGGEHITTCSKQAPRIIDPIQETRFGSQIRLGTATVLALGRSAGVRPFLRGACTCAGLITGAWARKKRRCGRAITITMGNLEYTVPVPKLDAFKASAFVDAAKSTGLRVVSRFLHQRRPVLN